MDLPDIPTPLAGTPIYPILLLSLAANYTPVTRRSFDCNYDYIVVGAGTAGSVVAARLSEDPSIRVLLLEAGPSPPPITEVPAITTHQFGSYIDWNITTTPQKYINNRVIPQPTGRCIGGSSIMTYTYYNRGNPSNYDDWEALGCKGWSYYDVLPFFKKLEDFQAPEFFNSDLHHVGGPITVANTVFKTITQTAAQRASRRTGLPLLDTSAITQPAVSDTVAHLRGGRRCSVAKGYLVPAQNRPNLHIVDNALVTKILIENQGATGVRFEFEGATYDVHAWREVVISAGAFHTPQLLMLSGIGPRKELEHFNIPVLADLPVGANLQDHPIVFHPYAVSPDIPPLDREIQDPDVINKFISCGIGPLSSAGGIDLTIFISALSNPPPQVAPDNEIYLIDGGRFEGSPGVETVLMCSSQILKTKSRGWVTLQSANAHDPPLVNPHYMEDPEDLQSIIRGLKYCDDFMASPEFLEIGTWRVPGYDDGCDVFKDNEYEFYACVARNGVETAFHPVGTAKMGDPSDPSTVLDYKLRVKGISNLRVADASIMPVIATGNTHTTVVMIGEKAADIIKNSRNCN